MDQPSSFEQLRGCLQSIEQVNRLTRAYHPTLDWLNHVYTRLPRLTQPLRILDLGCGYGDMLRRVERWARDRRLPVALTGLDLNPQAVQAARAATRPGAITYLTGDALAYAPAEGVDIVLSSLVMHHLESAQIVTLLDWMETHARIGWFINDLHRQPLPYYIFRTVARWMPWHPYVKHDGPISILRSFRRADWQTMLRAAAIAPDQYRVIDYRPARLCVARVK